MSFKQYILAAVVVGLTGIAGAAERPLAGGPGEPGSIGAPGRGEDRSNSPLRRQVMTVFLLPEMQSELGLSAQQESQLRGLQRNLLAKSKDIAGQTAARRRELDALLSGDTSRTRAVKALFEKIADLRAQLQYAGFDTANKMKASLNDAQRAKFNALKPADLHRLMMSHANTAEMEATMQWMAGEGIGTQQNPR